MLWFRKEIQIQQSWEGSWRTVCFSTTGLICCILQWGNDLNLLRRLQRPGSENGFNASTSVWCRFFWLTWFMFDFLEIQKSFSRFAEASRCAVETQTFSCLRLRFLIYYERFLLAPSLTHALVEATMQSVFSTKPSIWACVWGPGLINHRIKAVSHTGNIIHKFVHNIRHSALFSLPVEQLWGSNTGQCWKHPVG